MRTLGGQAGRLAEPAAWRFQDRTLIVELPAGRLLAEGRRAGRSDEVRRALVESFGEGAALDVVAVYGTGTEADRQVALEREVLDDPAAKRIISALGASVERVTSLRDGNGADGYTEGQHT